MECICPERRPHGNAASEDINSDDGDGCVDRVCSARLLPIPQSRRTFIMPATRPSLTETCVAKEGGEGMEGGGEKDGRESKVKRREGNGREGRRKKEK